MAKLSKRAALDFASKIWGRGKGTICDNGRPSSPASRVEGMLAARALVAAKPKILELTAVDPDMPVGAFLVALEASRVAMREWKVLHDAASSRGRYYRYEVGQSTFAFCIEGQGDSWEEAFAAAGYRSDGVRMSEEERRARRAARSAELVAAGYVEQPNVRVLSRAAAGGV